MAQHKPGQERPMPSYATGDEAQQVGAHGLRGQSQRVPPAHPSLTGLTSDQSHGFRAGQPQGVASGEAKVLERTWSGDPKDQDPARSIPGAPPNLGEGLLPHVISFQGIVSSVSRIYRPSDEAIKHSFDNAKFMRNDLVIQECIEQRQRALALLDWHIEPDDDKDPRQKEICDELKVILEQKMPRFMQYRENLAHATWFGRYATQHRFRWAKVRGNMRIVADRWLPVHGDKIVFRYDDGTREYDPDQIGIRVGAGFTTGSSLAKMWTVDRINKVEPTDYGLAYFLEKWERPLIAVHKHYIEDGEYEDPTNAGRIHGIGLRSRIYWTWYQKQETLAFMMEYLERSANGFEIWYFPMGNPQAEAAVREAAEQRIGQGRNIVIVPKPVGEDAAYFDMQRIEPSMAGVEAMKSIIIEYFGHLIKRYVLGQTLTTEAQATGLGSNLADVHMATFFQILKYDATLLEETITSDLVEPLKRFNWPEMSDVPLQFRINTTEENVQEKLEAWRMAFEMGKKIPSQDLGDMLGIRQPDEDEEVLSISDQQESQMRAKAGLEQQAKQMTSQEDDKQFLWNLLGGGANGGNGGQRFGNGKQYAAPGVPYENSERHRVA